MMKAIEVITALATIVRLHEGNRSPEINELLASVETVTHELSALQVKAFRWDDLEAARNKLHTKDDEAWQRLANRGDLIAAIKVCRALHGYGLRESKAVVDDYVRRIRA